MNDLSIWQLFFNASPFVKSVMLFLGVVSLFSWSFIFFKFWAARQHNDERKTFEQNFWSGVELNKLFEQQQNKQNKLFGLNAIFHAGFKNFTRLTHETDATFDEILQSAHRAMQVAVNEELAKSERFLSFFATVASVSPFIGLLGTVWGIMHAFIALGGMQQVTLNMVAPGIAEALVATAIGLMTAIPASIAYNAFAKSANACSHHYDTFKDEMLNVLQRQLLASNSR